MVKATLCNLSGFDLGTFKTATSVLKTRVTHISLYIIRSSDGHQMVLIAKLVGHTNLHVFYLKLNYLSKSGCTLCNGIIQELTLNGSHLPMLHAAFL